ncbi:MAG TPA: S8 family serine peptidase, partial [Candidatus Eisenbacteria bacterium]|nr:S8 family serine peptidase [Candidatus Eisenbacteria bacterium]
TQARVIAELTGARRAGLASEVRSLWSAGAVAAQVTPAELQRLARLEEIETIAWDPPQQMIEEESLEPAAISAPREATATPAWSVQWIGAPAVWGQGYRGACVLVAIIDTGVDYNHTDLVARIWTNGDEIPANGIDDDGNGYIDDVHGYDTAIPDSDPMDQNGHGTHVGGSVAGDGTAGTITGVAPDARLMAVKVLNANGSGTFAKIMEGIEYAVGNGAQVLNLSLGGLCTSPGTRASLRANADMVAAAGVTMCVASANDRCKQRPPNLVRSPGDAPPPWLSPDQPVLGALGGATTVGATGNMTDQVTTFSSNGPVDWSQPLGYGDWRICDPGTPNVGLIKPDVAAPGQDVLSTILGGGYGLNTGTSMATPHVAGLTALILSKNPMLTSDQVHQILETTALDLGPAGKDNDYGSGRVRAPDAIAATPAPASQPVQFVSSVVLDTIPPADGDGRLEPGETADLKVTFANAGPYLLGDVAGALTDGSPHVTVTDPLATFGDIPPSQTRNNAQNLWRVTVSPSAPVNMLVPFTATISSYGACVVVSFADTIQSPVVAVEPPAGVWPALALSDISPNPAGGAATLAFTIGSPGHVRLTLYDVRGRRVRTLVDGAREAGVHRETWNGRDDRGAALGAGVYLARVESAGLRAQRKFAWLGR